MTAAVQRAFAVWFTELDPWTVPSAASRDRPLPPGWRMAKVGSLVRQITDRIKVAQDVEFKMVGVKWYGEGTFHRETVRGDSLSATYLTPVVPGAFIYNRLFAWKGSFAVVPPEHGGHFVSGEFPQFTTDTAQVLPDYLRLYFTSPTALKAVNAASVGSAAVSRNRFKEEAFLGFQLPLPPPATQRAILAEWRKAQNAIAAAEERCRQIETEIDARFFADLGVGAPTSGPAPRFFAVHWTDVLRWSVSYSQTAFTGMDITRCQYPVVSLGSILDLVQYGTSEKANTRRDGAPVLRINNIKDGELDLIDLKHIPLAEKTLARLRLVAGDILIIRTSGSRDLVGTCAVFREIDPYVFASYLIRLRTSAERADPEFVAYFINSVIGRQQVDAISRQIMQNNITNQATV